MPRAGPGKQEEGWTRWGSRCTPLSPSLVFFTLSSPMCAQPSVALLEIRPRLSSTPGRVSAPQWVLGTLRDVPLQTCHLALYSQGTNSFPQILLHMQLPPWGACMPGTWSSTAGLPEMNQT